MYRMEVVVGMHAIQSQEGLVAYREMSEYFLSARLYSEDTRSHRHPGAQRWAWSSENWSAIREWPSR